MTKKSNIAAIIVILSSLFAVLCINANAEETSQQAENAGETAINIEKYEDDGPEPEESVQIPLAPSPQQEAAPIMLDGMDLNRLIPPPEIKKEDPPPNEVPVPAKEKKQPEKKAAEKKKKAEEPKTEIPRMKNPRHLSDIQIFGGYRSGASSYGAGGRGGGSFCVPCSRGTFVNKVRPATVGRPMNIRGFLKMPAQQDTYKKKPIYEGKEIYIKCRADCPPPPNAVPASIQVLPKNAVLVDYECAASQKQAYKCRPGSFMKIIFSNSKNGEK